MPRSGVASRVWSRASSPAVLFWTNLVLVLPLAIGAFVLYPGCGITGPACETNANCVGGAVCDTASGRCVLIVDFTTPFGPGQEVEVEPADETAGASSAFLVHIPIVGDTLQLLEAAIALTGGAEIQELTAGEEIGVFNYQDEGGLDLEFDILATAGDHACVDDNADGDCDAHEVEIVIVDDGSTPVIQIYAPLGGDGSAASKAIPDDGLVTIQLDAGIVVNPLVVGPWSVVGVFSSVSPTTGAEGPDQKTAQVVIDLFAQPPGGGAGCEVNALDNIEVHITAVPAIEVAQMGAVFEVPASSTGRNAVERVCVAGAWRPVQGGGGASQGNLQAVVYGLGPDGPDHLYGVSQPFFVSVSENEDTQCVEEVGIDVGDAEVVFVGVQWDSDLFDFAPAVEQDGVPRDGFVRLSDDGVCGLAEAPWVPLSSIGGGVSGIAVGASFREEMPIAIAPDAVGAWTTEVRPAELAAAVTNRGAVLAAASLVQKSAQDQAMRVAATNLYEPSTSTLGRGPATRDLQLNGNAFGVSKLVAGPEPDISQLSIVLGNVLQAIRVETEPNADGPPALEVTKETISSTPNHWESNLALVRDRPIVQAFRAQASPFLSLGVLYERESNGTWDEIATFDVPGRNDSGAVFRGCPRREFFSFRDSEYACTALPTATIAAGVCTEYQVALACCDLSDEPVECTYRDLTGTIPAGDRNAESAGFDFDVEAACAEFGEAPLAARDALEVPRVPAGAYFWVRGYQTATQSGVIDVATFAGNGAGGFAAAGTRTALEQVRTLGGFPNLTVHRDDGSDLFTLCASAVEGGAQRVRCSRWSMGGSADPADWRKTSTFLAPPAFNASSPIEIVGAGVEPRASTQLPLTLLGPSVTGTSGPATILAHPVLESLPCVPGPGVACLGEEDRFAVLADWRTPQGDTGIGTMREVTADSGVATFFNPTNVELFYKALDACGLPSFQSKWFFLTGLTNVEVVTTFLDTETGQARKYLNPIQRPFAPVLDTKAFTNCPLLAPGSGDDGLWDPPMASRSIPDAGALAAAVPFASLPDWALEALSEAAGRGGPPPAVVARSLDCVPSGTRLCLNQGRFAVEVSFAADNGSSGDGKPVYLTTDTGAFTFFNPQNLEVLVKVLDACATPFDSFWVFAAGLTNVGVELTVTDTATGAQKTYTNAQGAAFRPVQDITAFKTCDG